MRYLPTAIAVLEVLILAGVIALILRPATARPEPVHLIPAATIGATEVRQC